MTNIIKTETSFLDIHKLQNKNILVSCIEEIKDKLIINPPIFVFGKKVNDFKKLDYESLYCLNIAATQELYKLIQQQNAIIQDLQNRISILENNNI
jgi:hypothetical protein